MFRPLRFALPALLSATMLAAPALAKPAATPPQAHWVTTWATALVKPTFVFSNQGNYGYTNQTFRLSALTSQGGDAIRVRLTNRFGKTPLVIGHAAVGARHKPFNADLFPASVGQLTFGGKASVTIAPGEDVTSDPLPMAVLPNQLLGVDIFLPGPTGPLPYNFLTNSTQYSTEGDQAGNPSGKGFAASSSWLVLDAIEVENSASVGTVVACCDSVSMTGQADAWMRWPEILSREFNERYGARAPSVIHTTLSGQRLLTTSHYAENVLSRFQRDVLSETNVKAVILFVGVNDLGVPQMPAIDMFSPTNDVTADEMIDGYKKVVAMARARGVPVFGATVTPGSGYQHLGNPYWSPAQEVKRRKINTWLRSTDIFDKVFDFAAAVSNPLDDEYYRPGASTDNIHPNDSGQYLIAHSIDTGLIMRTIEGKAAARGRTRK